MLRLGDAAAAATGSVEFSEGDDVLELSTQVATGIAIGVAVGKVASVAAVGATDVEPENKPAILPITAPITVGLRGSGAKSLCVKGIAWGACRWFVVGGL